MQKIKHYLRRENKVPGGAHLQNQNYFVAESLNVWFKIKSIAIKIPTIVPIILMKWNSIKELVKGTHNDTQCQDNAHPKTRPIDCGGV